MEKINNSGRTGMDFTGKNAKDADQKSESYSLDPSTEIKDDDVAASQTPLEPAPPKRILVIDDEPSIRRLFSNILKKAGYEVMLAAGGKEGLRLFREAPADLIITDIVMPEMSGHDFIIDLKKDFSDVKIIAMSGDQYVGPEIELFIAESLGAARVFSKPFKVDEVLDAIKMLLHQETASDGPIEKPVETSAPVTKEKETILLVDDDEIILETIKETLTRLGYIVFTAKSGPEAVQVYCERKDKIDLVILDMIMPDIDGSEVFDALKRMNKNVKVLLTSGYGLDGQASAIMTRGCNGFIQKPFNIKSLSQKIRTILEWTKTG